MKLLLSIMLKRECTPYATRLFQLPMFISYSGSLGVLLQTSLQIYRKLNLHVSKAKYILEIRLVFPVISTFCIPMKICVVNTTLESHIPKKFHLHKAQEILQQKYLQCFLEEWPWQVILKMLCTIVAKDLKRKYLLATKWKLILKYTCEYLSEDVRPSKNFKCKHDNFNQILIQNSENP